MPLLKKLLYVIGLLLFLPGCSPKKETHAENHVNEEAEDRAPSLQQETPIQSNQREKEIIISEGIIRYGIVLSEDEKSKILEPARVALNEVFRDENLEILRSKFELKLDIREAQLKDDPTFGSLLDEHLGNSFTQVEWQNIIASIPDLSVLSDTRRKLEEQYPKSVEEALRQAQDALFKQALTQKLRDEITKEITSVTSPEVEDFRTNYRNGSTSYVLYMSKHRNFEAATLELKKDLFWNHWIASQQK